MKTCTRCLIAKDGAEFYRCAKSRDGLGYWCAPCARAVKRAWDVLNPLRHKELRRRWTAANPAKRLVHKARYRARASRAVPAWYGELDQLVADEAAALCRLRKELTGVDWHVDHEIPLNGERVCGLHVWNNLQVITAIANVAKGNRF